MSDDVDTSAEACAVACMFVSDPAGVMRYVGWQRRVNDLIRALRDERDALRDELATVRAAVIEECAAVVEDLVENDPLLLPRVAAAIRALAKTGESRD